VHQVGDQPRLFECCNYFYRQLARVARASLGPLLLHVLIACAGTTLLFIRILRHYAFYGPHNCSIYNLLIQTHFCFGNLLEL
jgi:hypothetical protein